MALRARVRPQPTRVTDDTQQRAEVYDDDVIDAFQGEKDAAIDELERLLSIPSPLSVPLLRLDPIWDPLRHHPQFQRLVDGEN